jgi:hypothetical protein
VRQDIGEVGIGKAYVLVGTVFVGVDVGFFFGLAMVSTAWMRELRSVGTAIIRWS